MTGDIREQLRVDLINAFCASMPAEKREDIGIRLSVILSRYEITERHTEIVPYQGDANEIIIKRFLAAKIAKGCSRRTIRYYGHTIPRTLQAIGKVYSEVTADDVRLYIATRISIDKVSKATVNNERRNISSFYDWLQKEEILLKNPMAKIEPVKETRKKKKAYSLLDIEKIRYGCRTQRETALIETLASTWARVSEVAQMKIDEIDGENQA